MAKGGLLIQLQLPIEAMKATQRFYLVWVVFCSRMKHFTQNISMI